MPESSQVTVGAAISDAAKTETTALKGPAIPRSSNAVPSRVSP
jgi:hypothetical protein